MQCIHEPMLFTMQLHEVVRIRRTSANDTDDHNEQTLIDVSHDVEKKSFQLETFSTVMFLREFSKFRLNDVCGVLPWKYLSLDEESEVSINL